MQSTAGQRRRVVAEFWIRAWECAICGHAWLSETKPPRCANHKCRSRRWVPESLIISSPSPEDYKLAAGQARHWAYKCDVCGHVWLARHKNKPKRCASGKCKSSKWNRGVATPMAVLKFHAGVKVV